MKTWKPLKVILHHVTHLNKSVLFCSMSQTNHSDSLFKIENETEFCKCVQPDIRIIWHALFRPFAPLVQFPYPCILYVLVKWGKWFTNYKRDEDHWFLIFWFFIHHLFRWSMQPADSFIISKSSFFFFFSRMQRKRNSKETKETHNENRNEKKSMWFDQAALLGQTHTNSIAWEGKRSNLRWKWLSPFHKNFREDVKI